MKSPTRYFVALSAALLLLSGCAIEEELPESAGLSEGSLFAATLGYEPPPVPEVENETVFALPAPAPLKWQPVWNPPDQRLFQVVDAAHGYTDGTTQFLVIHSCKNGQCLGSRLLNSGLEPGDILRIDNFADYRLTEVFESKKTELPARLWDNPHPEKLVLVTCLQDGSPGLATQNVFFVGERLAPGEVTG